MKKIYKSKFPAIYLLFALGLFGTLFISFSSGYDSESTLANGGSTCASCHSGGSLNGAVGSVTLTGVPATYVNGQTYPLTLTVCGDGNSGLAGFQIVAVNPAAQTAPVGTFSPGTGSRLMTGAPLGLTHSSAIVTNGGTGDCASWTFTWNAPATGSTPVQFFFVGNAADGNGGSSGDDDIYTGNSVSVPLPIELVSFEAKSNGTSVSVHWQTAEETNNNYFEIERSADGRNFEVVGNVKSVGESTVTQSYHFLDRFAEVSAVPVFYYRIKQVDFGGKYKYSNLVSVDMPLIKELVTVLPNPATASGEIQLLTKETPKYVVLYNLSGSEIRLSGNGSNKYTLPADLLAGAYFMTLFYENKTPDTRKILIK